MKNKNLEMILFGIIMVFILFSNRLNPQVSLSITGILLVGIFVYRAKNKKNEDK